MIRGGGMEPHAFSGMRAGYLRHSIYAPFMRLLLEQFGRERVFIVDAAEFFQDPRSTTKRIYEFLELPIVEPLLIEERNSGPSGELDYGIRADLTAFFRPYNESLYALLDRDFGWGSADRADVGHTPIQAVKAGGLHAPAFRQYMEDPETSAGSRRG
ncbi:MAG: hypothetical protein ACR65U_04130 [Methylocystis sp.]